MKDHVIICGLGSIGFRTFSILKSTNHQIVAISTTTQDECRWQIESHGGIFLLGDARDENLLIKAGIKDAKAILALTEQDAVNVSIAMDARKLNPRVKIIMRMLDNELGKRIKNELGIHQIFSSSELAAPIFTSSIHDNLSITQFKIKDKDYFVSEEEKHKTRMTEHSFLLEEYSFQNKSTYLVAHPAKKYKKKKHGFLRFIGKFNYLLSPIFSNIRQFLFLVLCVILTAAFFLHWAMNLGYIDALYFVTTTVTTVGYGDFNFSNSNAGLKIFGCFLMISGAAALAMLFSSITEIILSKKLPSFLGGRPVPKKDHVILVGSGPVGHSIASTLIEDDVPIVIVEESTKDHYSDDINRKVALVDGNLKSADTLKRANIHSAKAIVIITNNDIENLSISLAAKNINPKLLNIIHVFSPTLGEKLKSSLSLDTVLCLPKIVAPYFAAAVLGDDILLALEWKNQLIYLSQQPNEKGEANENFQKTNKVLEKNIMLHTLPLKKFE